MIRDRNTIQKIRGLYNKKGEKFKWDESEGEKGKVVCELHC